MLYQKQIEEIERNDRLYAAEVERLTKHESRDRQIPIPPRDKPKPSVNKYLSHSPEASPNLHYACLDLAPGSRKIVLESPERKYTKISLQSHTPEKKVVPVADVPPPRPAKASHLRKNPPVSPSKNSSDGVDSIRPYSDIDSALDEALDLEMQNLDINNLYKPVQNGFNAAQYNPNIQQRHPHHQYLEDGRNILKMSAVENDQRRQDRLSDEAGAVGFSADAFKDLGLSSDEIKEFERLKQEEEDKEYALRLERELADRMFAQETQDRLLAEALFKRDKKKQQLKKKEQQQKKQLQKAQQSEMEQYSNPVDMLQGEQHQKHPRSPEGSQHKHQKQSSFNSQSSYNSGESYPQDDSYSNPFDMVPPLRPNHLELRGPVNRPQMPRAHLPEDQNIAAMIDPTYTVPLHPSSQNTVANATTPDILEHYEDKSTAPYMPGNMPIQGTRRNSSNEKKRKQKERCNQQ